MEAISANIQRETRIIELHREILACPYLGRGGPSSVEGDMLIATCEESVRKARIALKKEQDSLDENMIRLKLEMTRSAHLDDESLPRPGVAFIKISLLEDARVDVRAFPR